VQPIEFHFLETAIQSARWAHLNSIGNPKFAVYQRPDGKRFRIVGNPTFEYQRPDGKRFRIVGNPTFESFEWSLIFTIETVNGIQSETRWNR
jgi:hypothetical protein